MMNLVSRRTLLALLGGASLLALAPAGAKADTEQEARDFLAAVGNRAIQDLTDTAADRSERVKRFRDLLVESVDFALISQVVLGRFWKSADDATRDEFNRVLRETLIFKFLPLFEKYEGEAFNVTGSRVSTKDPSVVACTTDVVAPSGDVAKVEWYMKKFEDRGFRIYDFNAEGIKLTTSLNDEYDAFLRQNDGDVAKLISEMRAKLPAEAAPDA